jgi:hypothetical protein
MNRGNLVEVDLLLAVNLIWSDMVGGCPTNTSTPPPMALNLHH